MWLDIRDATHKQFDVCTMGAGCDSTSEMRPRYIWDEIRIMKPKALLTGPVKFAWAADRTRDVQYGHWVRFDMLTIGLCMLITGPGKMCSRCKPNYRRSPASTHKGPVVIGHVQWSLDAIRRA